MPTIIDGTAGITFPNSTVQASAGQVLQVVSVSNNTQFSTSSTSFVTTGFSASITPKFANSKIYIFSTMCWYGTGFVTVYRNTTNIGNATSGFFSESEPTAYENSTALSYLDSPATTSSTTYTIYTKAVSPLSMWLNINPTVSTITLMEIAA